MNKAKLVINDTLCGETREVRRINSGKFNGILSVTPHFGWHRVDENFGISRSEGLSDEYLIIMTVDGRGDIFINRDKYTADKNKISVLPPAMPHSYNTTEGVWEFFWIHIKKCKNTDILDFITRECGYVFPSVNIEQLTDKINTLLESQMFGIDAEINDSRVISQLLHDMLEQSVKDINMGQDYSDVVMEILNYIYSHYMEKITIEDLSRLIYKSAGHTIRVFKYYTGYTPIEYIKKYRIMKACQLLDATNCPIKSIAHETGYKSVSHFIADFREMKSVTPQEYREKMTKVQKWH